MSERVTLTWRPLTQWPAGRPRTPAHQREGAKFKAAGRLVTDTTGGQRWESGDRTPLSRTLEDLDRELWHIGARDVVVQVDVASEAELRRDGMPTHRARVNTPAVVLTFRRRDIAHVFACDRFERWQDNLRGIALGLEGLRRLERYGIVQAGEQYRGWQALPASTTPTLSTEQAAAVLARYARWSSPSELLVNRHIARTVYRAAAAAVHPDRDGGSTADFQLVQEAKRVLEQHYGGAL